MIKNKYLEIIFQYLDNIEDICADTQYWNDYMWTEENIYDLIDKIRESVDSIEDTIALRHWES